MALEIFKLVGSIFVDTEEANKSIAKTDSKAEKVGKTLAAGIGTAAKWSAGLVTGAAGVVTGLAAVASKSAAVADNIDKQSQKLSMSAKTYQELDYVCQLYGTDVDKMGTAMKSVTTALSSNSDAFKKLGVATTDSSGNLRSAEDVFLESLDALKGVSNETERNTLANSLYGKSYQELLPLLNDSSTSVADLRQRAEELGLVMSDDTVKAGASLTDAMTEVKASFSAVATNLGAALMPILKEVCSTIVNFMPQVASLVSTLTPVITELFSGLLPPLIDLIKSIVPVLIELIKKLIPPITQIIKALIPILIKLVQTVIPPLVKIVDALLPVLMQLLLPIIDLLEPIIDLLEPILDLVIALIMPVINLISIALKPLITIIDGRLKTSLTMLKNLLSPIINTFVNFGNVVTNVFSNIRKAIKLPHFSIEPSGWQIADLLKGSIPHLSVDWYAKGAVLNKPTAFGINGDSIMAGGEAGPEAVAPIAVLQDYIVDAVEASNSQLYGVVNDILTLLTANIPALANSQLVLDTGALVGYTVRDYDEALGRLAARRKRGA